MAIAQDNHCTCESDPSITCILHPATCPQAVEAARLAHQAKLDAARAAGIPLCGMMGRPVNEDDGVCMTIRLGVGHRNHIWGLGGGSSYKAACECGFIATPSAVLREVEAQLVDHYMPAFPA